MGERREREREREGNREAKERVTEWERERDAFICEGLFIIQKLW